MSLRRILGMQLVPDSIKDCLCPCGQKMTNEHAQTCSHNYEITDRHNAIRDQIASIINYVRLLAHVEPHVGIGNLRWDINIENLPHDEAGPVFLDITVTSPLQIKYLNSTAVYRQGQAVKDAARYKSNKYGKFMNVQPANSIFKPLAFT